MTSLNNLTVEKVAEFLELSCLDPLASEKQILKNIADSTSKGIKYFCVYPSVIPLAVPVESNLITVSGYPEGKHQPLVKAAEARFAVECGATEINLSVDMQNIVNSDFSNFLTELVTVKEAVGEIQVKASFEVDQLDFKKTNLLKNMVNMLQQAGIEWIHLNSFTTEKVKANSIELLQELNLKDLQISVGNTVPITVNQVIDYILAGATRISLLNPQEILVKISEIA